MTATTYATFGVQYARFPHPHLPPALVHPDGYLQVTVTGTDEYAVAVEYVFALTRGRHGTLYSDVTDVSTYHFPRWCLAVITVTADTAQRAIKQWRADTA